MSAAVGGLAGGTIYRYRLSAATTGALGGAETTASLPFTAPAAPRVESTAASNLSSSFAELHARIDPAGADATYQFQYVDAADYEAGAPDPYAAGGSAPVSPADIGSGGATGSVAASVVQQVGGLSPGTVYHYRVVAGNAFGVTMGPDETFGTLPAASAGLPDGRVYELVTPADRGTAVELFGGSPQEESGQYADQEVGFASPDGSRFLLATTLAAFGPFPASETNAYLFARGPHGWTSTSLASPSFGVQNLGLGVFDPSDFSTVGINDYVGSQSASSGASLNDVVGPPGGPYSDLHVDPPSRHNRQEDTEETHVVGGSRDLSHVVLETLGNAVCPGATALDAGSHVLCEYANGESKLVNADSEGKLLSRCGAVLGQGHLSGSGHDAVSADGSRVIFTAPDPYAKNTGFGCWNGETTNPPELYMRSDGETTEISAPSEEEGTPEGTARHPAAYVGASEDGSKVFFLSEGELTRDDAHIHDRELYEYDTETGQLTRISHGESGVAAAGVWTVPAVSADGAAVYFTASGALANGATAYPVPSGPAGGGAGTPINLYRYDTVTGATTFVTTVGQDYPDNEIEGAWYKWVALQPSGNWYTTPDGRYLLFATQIEQAGYDNAGMCPVPGRGEPGIHRCDEVYRYDATSGSLICLSCDPSGAAPVSDALFSRSMEDSQLPSAGSTRAMSDDGAYAFFDTADPLVPQDTNGTLDAYEWHEGHVSLLSTGHDPAPSFFLGASASGGDVFIATHSNLVPSQNTDSKADIYDARICTAAEPCIQPPAGETAQCEGSACQTPPSAPNDATPSSLTFSGAGDATTGGPPLAPPPPAKRTAAQVRAAQLARALKVCHRDRVKTRRVACERRARTRYGPHAAAKTTAKGRK
ncbi:MAG TPA: hypothetical protein VMH39_13130 [Gemmatimonadaceae bacterium]|nr:hypothetical protein [Gemmatimonadaceae bacterium]